MLSEVKQVTIVLSGEVQYIGLRAEMEELLARHGFPGFVYNDARDGTLKLVCEGEDAEIKQLIAEISAGRPEVRASLKEGVTLPKPAGRVVVGMEREIFERLDLGVDRLGSMDEKLNRLESMDAKLGSVDEKLSSVDDTLRFTNKKLDKLDVIDKKLDTLEDIKKLLEKIAEK